MDSDAQPERSPGQQDDDLKCSKCGQTKDADQFKVESNRDAEANTTCLSCCETQTSKGSESVGLGSTESAIEVAMRRRGEEDNASRDQGAIAIATQAAASSNWIALDTIGMSATNLKFGPRISLTLKC